MNWEETVVRIRKDPEYSGLIRDAYLEEDLDLNVHRFAGCSEFSETLSILNAAGAVVQDSSVLDVGGGNGISAFAFANRGARVSVLEPDRSDTVGAGAIRTIAERYKLETMEVVAGFAEEMPFADSRFDIVYCRQSLHHAADLVKFMQECARVLKKGGLFFSVRDHVIYNREDKNTFLRTHPLHKFYGGENAFTLPEYSEAIRKAGLKIIRKLGHYDSVINYSPLSESDIRSMKEQRKQMIENLFSTRVPALVRIIPGVRRLHSLWAGYRLGPAPDESKVPGRLVSFLARKA